jgi:predicted ester cyclase
VLKTFPSANVSRIFEPVSYLYFNVTDLVGSNRMKALKSTNSTWFLSDYYDVNNATTANFDDLCLPREVLISGHTGINATLMNWTQKEDQNPRKKPNISDIYQNGKQIFFKTNGTNNIYTCVDKKIEFVVKDPTLFVLGDFDTYF